MEVTLRDYVDKLFEQQKVYIDSRFTAIAEAVQTANAANDKRLELLNEFRATINDSQAAFVRNRAFQALKEKVDESGGRRTTIVAMSGVMVTVVIVLLTFSLRGGLSREDVKAQILTEAPWVADRDGVLRRISDIEALDKFFCRTRPQANLPSC